jgi:hypothetical protein
VREFGRLPGMPSRDDVPEDELDAYDRVVERTGRVHGLDSNPAQYFKAILNAPSLAEGIVGMGTLVRQGQLRGSYTDAERELVDVVYGEDLDYRGHYTVHIPDCFAVGVRPEAIQALRTGREDDLTDHERLIADHARRVAAGEVTDESYAPIRAHFGERGAIEFTIFCAFLLMTLRLWQALGVPDPTNEEIDALIAGLRNGTIPVPPADARIG